MRLRWNAVCSYLIETQASTGFTDTEIGTNLRLLHPPKWWFGVAPATPFFCLEPGESGRAQPVQRPPGVVENPLFPGILLLFLAPAFGKMPRSLGVSLEQS